MRFNHRLRSRFALCIYFFPLILTLSRSGRGEGESASARASSGFTYQLALPGRKITFPEDHYSHPNFKTEWWYYTGHLESESGKRYGYQVTFFRFGLRDRQNEAKEKPQFSELYMAHFALSDINAKEFRYRERINRGYNGKAGAATDRYLVWNEDWKVEGDHNDHKIRVNDRGTELQLNLKSLKLPVLHGSNGLSQKAAGQGRASYYYSLTRMQTEGVLKVDGKADKVRGLSWMDHEFGSNQLGQDQVGWDWFSIQLDDQTELMLYLMRRKDGTVDPYLEWHFSECEWFDSASRSQRLSGRSVARWKSPTSGANYPMKWKVTIPTGTDRARNQSGISQAGIDHQSQHAGDLLGRSGQCSWNSPRKDGQRRGICGDDRVRGQAKLVNHE